MPGFHARDLTGRTFGSWTVLGRAVNPRPGGTMWLCRCACNTEHAVSGGTLNDGRSKGCRRCAAFQRHRDNPALSAHLPQLSRPTWARTCVTCGVGFRGTVRQVYCSAPCRPSALPTRREKRAALEPLSGPGRPDGSARGERHLPLTSEPARAVEGLVAPAS